VHERGSNRYQLGPAVLRLGDVYLDTIELPSKAIPWAEAVARRTGLAVRTAVLLLDVVIIHHEPRQDFSRRCPRSASSSRPTRTHSAVDPGFTGPEGRPAGRAPLGSMTDETITSREALEAELEWSAPPGWPTRWRKRCSARAASPPGLRCHADVAGAIGVVVPSGGMAGRPGDVVD